MKQSPLNSNSVSQLVSKQINRPIVLRPQDVVIACDLRDCTRSRVPDPNWGMMRKATYAFFKFIGYRRVIDPVKRRLED